MNNDIDNKDIGKSNILGNTGDTTISINDTGDDDIDDNSPLMWAPDDFGQYSIDKINLITNILKGLLSDITIKTDQQGREDVYTKTESNKIFVQRTEFTNMAGDLIHSLTDSYLKEQSEQGKIVNSLTTDDIVKVLDVIAKKNYGESYETILSKFKDLGDYPVGYGFNTLLDRVNNLDSSSTSIKNQIIWLQNQVYGTTNNLASDTPTILVKKSEISSLEDTVNKCNTSVSGMKSTVDSTSTTVSSLVTKVGTNTLNTTEKNLTDAVNSLAKDVSNLQSNSSTSVSSLSARVSSLESSTNNNISTINSNIDTIKKSIEDNKSTLNTSISNNASNIASLENKLKTANDTIAKLQSALTSASNKIDTLTNQLSTTTATANNLNSMLEGNIPTNYQGNVIKWLEALNAKVFSNT